MVHSIAASYRDPSGYIFNHNNTFYRFVNESYKNHYNTLMTSGLYDELVKTNRLIAHKELNEVDGLELSTAYKILLPEQLSHISYPYEWSFEMLKEAAILTLDIAIKALDYDMILKDATPFNIQFHNGKLRFIDTLSFEQWNEKPWIAYRQFCETFIGPLITSHYHQIPIDKLSTAWPEGMPIQYIAKMLPWSARFKLHQYLHIKLHAKVALKERDNNEVSKSKNVMYTKQQMKNLLQSLRSLVLGLKGSDSAAIWDTYYNEANTRDNYVEVKTTMINSWLSQLQNIQSVADLGTNDGYFAKLAATHSPLVIAADFDSNCIDRLYKEITASPTLSHVHPLVLDLSLPTPAIGVNNEERPSFLQRLKVDVIMSLAVIHHLAIGKNMNFDQIAKLYLHTQKYLLIEYVPKSDEKIQFMLGNKADIYNHYTMEAFESVFTQYFQILKKENIAQSGRTLYLMEKR